VIRIRRIVAFLLLLTIGASSVEVLLGGEPAVASTSVIAAAPPDAAPAHNEGGGDDCACLCACGCPGAQLAVAPSQPMFDFGTIHVEIAVARTYRSTLLLDAHPPFRPPLA
jgi:hypothetical protein